MPNEVLFKRIVNEGYCCIKGYLHLCKARGETPKSMGKFLQMSPGVIRYHYRLDKANPYKCQNHPECLQGVVSELKTEKSSDNPDQS